MIPALSCSRKPVHGKGAELVAVEESPGPGGVICHVPVPAMAFSVLSVTLLLCCFLVGFKNRSKYDIYNIIFTF